MTMALKYTYQPTCDAEIGRVPDWRRCGRKATWARESASGMILTYCAKHRERAVHPKPENMKPAPMSEAYEITA